MITCTYHTLRHHTICTIHTHTHAALFHTACSQPPPCLPSTTYHMPSSLPCLAAPLLPAAFLLPGTFPATFFFTVLYYTPCLQPPPVPMPTCPAHSFCLCPTFACSAFYPTMDYLPSSCTFYYLPVCSAFFSGFVLTLFFYRVWTPFCTFLVSLSLPFTHVGEQCLACRL